MKKKSNKQWKLAVGVLLFCIVGLSWLLIYNINQISLRDDLWLGVPTIDIELNGVSLSEIKDGSKEIKYPENKARIEYNNKSLVLDDVEIKGRGNTTWSYDKKSYQIKFSDKVDLFGMGKARKWVLISNYIDPTFMRDDIAFIIAEMIGEEYNTKGEFVNLYFNGEYEGLYYLLHKIEIDKNSVDIRNNDGVIFELDNIHSEDEKKYESYFGDILVLKDMILENSEKKDEIIDEFLEDYSDFEKALEKKDYDKVNKIIDVDSFVKYYLVNEFTNNPDAYSSSFYLYRNDDGKICAGPVWDFDFALGNKEWVWRADDEFLSPIGREKNMSSKMIKYLVNMPGFKGKVAELFKNKLVGKKDLLIQTIDDRVSKIIDDIKINNEKWEIDDFETNYEELIDWIRERYFYLENEYDGGIRDTIDQKRYQSL